MFIEIMPPIQQTQLIEGIKKAISRIADEISQLVEKVFFAIDVANARPMLREIVQIIDSSELDWDKLVKIEKKRKALPSRIEEAYKKAIANIEDEPAKRWSKACAFFKALS